jgi:hypothetical protein
MNLNGKRVDLSQLAAEMTAAGVNHRGLGVTGDDLHTYAANGAFADLPAAAAAVLAAHTPPPIPAAPDFGNDAAPTDQVADAVTQLRAYLGVANPTAAQSAAALKLVIRGLLFILRRVY